MPRRLFVPLSVDFFDDDRMIACTDGAQLLYLAMLCWVKRNHADGRVTLGQMTRLNRPKWRVEVRELARVEAVHYIEELRTYQVGAWFSWNLASDLLADRRAQARDRKRQERSGIIRPAVGVTDTVTGNGRTENGRRSHTRDGHSHQSELEVEEEEERVVVLRDQRQ